MCSNQFDPKELLFGEKVGNMNSTIHWKSIQSRVVTWSPGIVWIFNVWWSKKKKNLKKKKKIQFFFFDYFFNTQWSKWSRLCQIFTSSIRLVKPLENDIPIPEYQPIRKSYIFSTDLSAWNSTTDITLTKGYSHLVLVESADANSASKLFLALTNNDFNSKFILQHSHYSRNC